MPARFFTANGPNLYGKYLQGPVQWAELKDPADLAEIYQKGCLPYSGDLKSGLHLFYMSRSLRIDLKHFRLGKKRRYDHREWEKHRLQRKLTPADEFKSAHGDKLLDLACRWMEPRFGDAAISRERLDYILQKPYLKSILSWHRMDELAAFALVPWGKWGAHYWYVFYENGGNETFAPGHGYLVDFLQWCKSMSLPHAWLGTAYSTKSAYKSRGIEGIEFWDGEKWNPDKSILASLQQDDDRRFSGHPLSSP